MSAAFWIATLASGSSGNSIYAECPDGAVLIDAGISGRRIAERIESVGGHIDRVDAVIVTHEHADHAKSSGVISRRHGVPLVMTEGTYEGCRRIIRKVNGLRLFQTGMTLSLGGFRVHTSATPHDGNDPVALVLERDKLRCGVLTDLGHPFVELIELFPSLDAVLLESNYDPDMLEHGPYHENLKDRIRSDAGHISNEEAATLVRDHAGGRLQKVMLAHLSAINNTPLNAHACMETWAGSRIREQQIDLSVAPRHEPSAVLSVGPRT